MLPQPSGLPSALATADCTSFAVALCLRNEVLVVVAAPLTESTNVPPEAPVSETV